MTIPEYAVMEGLVRLAIRPTVPHRRIGVGLGPSILPALLKDLDDHLGVPWEEAFRMHLRRLAVAGKLGPEVVAVGPWWSSGADTEIDVVVLAGRSRKVRLVGEAKWARKGDSRPLVRQLERKAAMLPHREESVRCVLAAREEISNVGPETLTVTSKDIFDPSANLR